MDLHGKALSPAERWDDAVKKLYPTAPAGQKKSAPRAAYIGLCDAGLVKGVTNPGSSALSSSGNRNKDYALHAVTLLKAGTHKTITQLWSAVTEGNVDAQHAAQMDVVLALWKNDLIA
jgi:hypothetical protein